MTPPGGAERVASLWRLTWDGTNMLVCSVCRDGNRLLLCLESSSALILSEPFDLQPRAIARAQALRESLKRRGWQDAVVEATGPDASPAG